MAASILGQGTAFDEFFQVPVGRVIIDGAGGTDFIHTVDNFDQVLFGGDLRDLIISEGTGNDLIFGDSPGDGVDGADDSVFLRDIIAAGKGNDIVFAQTGPDYVNGEQGDDHIHGGFGGDFLQGGSGNDFVEGGPGDDILFGGTTPGTIPVGYLFTVTTDHNGVSGRRPGWTFHQFAQRRRTSHHQHRQRLSRRRRWQRCPPWPGWG